MAVIKLLRTLPVAWITAFPSVLAADEPVIFAPGIEFAGAELELKGTAYAYYLRWIKIYKAALYGPASVAARLLLDMQAPMCLEIHYLKPIERGIFIEAANKILQRQHTRQELQDLRARIDQLHKAYVNVGPGDRYSLCYSPKAGTTLLLNGEPRVTVEGQDFARAYLGIWLGKEPLSESLRDELIDGS